MWALYLTSAALAGACLTAAACWALWRRAQARHLADRALARIAADAERQQARHALTALAGLARTSATPPQRERLDLVLWAWEDGADCE
ncbi:hypothetical protein [Kitasatospora cineracea]|uniref:Uncharacterized protein n=1 Tax=Kitasatospora cineracea TaxID=88074 RepID=A0A3N4R215_9ACTN|nr:hypothetical protein [Kitasatospora cineracea]RPE27232.1 hypothetical protein EDD38_7376 [Kitasatospora cineracea]RPE27364.1 hypothetical protein EDD38_7509 [Kitasatospora cineracea]